MYSDAISASFRSGHSPWRRVRGVLLLTSFLAGLPAEATAGFVLFAAGGANPADIAAERDAFRSAVGGGSTAGANGDFGGVRREINWDGVPDSFSDPNFLPGDFFNSNSPRGVLLTTPGSGLLVSANAGGAVAPLFGFPGDLQTFSAQKLFAPVGSNVLDVRFVVPGTGTAATTGAFAAIFVDAEENNAVDATKMEFFDASGALLFSHTALATPNQGLSFLGGVADAGERISRVRITMPNNFLVRNGVRDNEQTDFVVMDDFLFATPVAVPEPATGMLSALALALLAGVRRRLSRTTFTA